MATASYMDGRVKYKRPQALILSDNPGTLVTSWASTGKVATTISSNSTTIQVTSDMSGIYPGQIIEQTNDPTGSGNGSLGSGTVTIVSVNLASKQIEVSKAHTKTGTLVFRTGSTSYVPEGVEFENFIILSDHNRAPLDMNTDRLEKRERMINGRMRSYHVADKKKIGTSWSGLPSRAYPQAPEINATTGLSSIEALAYTVDGGAGGNDLLKWYEDHVGSFWVFVAYDKYPQFGEDSKAYGHMHQYNEVLEMYMADFSHKVNKRGTLYDMWDVSLTLEEA